MRLLKGLLHHLNPDKVVDETLRDFFGGRLPPYEKEAKKGKYVGVFSIFFLNWFWTIMPLLINSLPRFMDLHECFAICCIVSVRLKKKQIMTEIFFNGMHQNKYLQTNCIEIILLLLQNIFEVTRILI